MARRLATVARHLCLGEGSHPTPDGPATNDGLFRFKVREEKKDCANGLPNPVALLGHARGGSWHSFAYEVGASALNSAAHSVYSLYIATIQHHGVAVVSLTAYVDAYLMIQRQG